MHGVMVAVISTSAIVGMDRSDMSVTMASQPWGDSTSQIEALDVQIHRIEDQITAARKAFSSDDQAVQRALRETASPARGRGVAEPAEARKSFLGGYGDAVIQAFQSWTAYLTNSKEYWKKQHAGMVAQYDRKSELSLEIFTLYAEHDQALKERESLKVAFLKEQNALIAGKLQERSSTVRDVARAAGLDVKSTGTVSGINREALAAQIRSNNAAAPKVAADEF